MDYESAKLMYEMYIEAEKAVLTSKSYTLADGVSLTRVDLADIRKNQRYWKKEMDILNPSNPRKKGIKIKLASYNHVD